MINIGGNIGEVYVGSTKIAEAYVGNQLVYSAGPPLPYDSKVEYLEGTGTQWIDTGISSTNGLLLDYTCSYDALTQSIVTTGDKSSNIVRIYLYNAYHIQIWKVGKAVSVRVYPKLNTFYQISHDFRGFTNKVVWNGSVVYNTNSSTAHTATDNVVIFKEYSYIRKGKIASLKITNINDEVVLDMIPVRVGTVGYMYDKVSKQMFSNAGTGSFTLGPDVT